MKYIIILTALFASAAQAACLPSKGTAVVSGIPGRTSLIWDIQYPGHSYRISYGGGDTIAVRQDSSAWKRAPITSVLRYKWTAVNVTTCEISRLLHVFENYPTLWK